MDFKEYQKFADSVARYPNRGNNYIYATLGLVGESGEVAEKIKKLIREKDHELTPEFKKEVLKEIGDVLWFVATFAYEMGADIEEVARLNVEKLTSRMERDVVYGDGDNR